MAQTLLGVVVGRWDVGFAQAGETERLFGAQQAPPKRFDRRKADRLKAQRVEFFPQDFFLRQRLTGIQFSGQGASLTIDTYIKTTNTFTYRGHSMGKLEPRPHRGGPDRRW